LLVEVEITGAISETSGQQIKETLLGCRHELQAVESRLVIIHDLLQNENISPEEFAGKLMK
jgi:Trp operon repressor